MTNMTPVVSLERIVEASAGIARLRQFVLDAAVSGGLVTRAAFRDGSVSNMLESIVADGTSDRKSVSSGSDAQTAKPIPQNWKWMRLGDIGRIFGGNSVNDSEKAILSRVRDGYPFIATKDVGYGSERLHYENGLKVPFSDGSYKIAHKDAVLICAEGGSAGKKCGIADRDICFGNKLYAIELNEGINPSYVLLAYQSSPFYQSFVSRMTGMIGGVSLREFHQISIPVPPLAEQEEIVELVAALMEIIDNLEIAKRKRDETQDQFVLSSLHRILAVEKTNEGENREMAGSLHSQIHAITERLSSSEHVARLRYAIASLAIRGRVVQRSDEDESVSTLLENIQTERRQLIQNGILRKTEELPLVEAEEVFRIPDHWSWVRLQDIVVFGPQNGISPRKSARPNAPRALTLTATTSGIFDPRYFKTVDAEIESNSEFWLKPGDLIFQRGNSREYVGIAAVYKGEANSFLYPDLMIKVRISECVNIDYIHLFANSPFAREYFMARATGAQSTMPKINQAILLALPIALPPKGEQLRIVSAVSKLMATCDELSDGFRLHETDTEKYLESIFGGSQLLHVGGHRPVDKAAAKITEDNMKADFAPVKPLADKMEVTTRRGPVNSVDDLVDCVKSFAGSVAPRELFGASGMGHSNDEIENFFDLLRIARITGRLSVPIGEGRVEDIANED